MRLPFRRLVRRAPPSRRCRLGFDRLEDRTLLSVTFTPGPLTVPATSGPDTALGTLSFRPVEPFASVNPVNPGQVAVSSHAGLKVSNNGSAGFTTAPAFPGSTGGDTGTVYDHAGRLFWVNIGGAGISIVQVNPATGAIVAGPFTVDNGGGADDKPFIAADPTTNNLYVIWTAFPSSGGSQILLRRSTNQGASWSAPVRVDNGADGFVWPAAVGVAPNGYVYAAYHSVLGFSNNAPDHTGKIVVVRFNNDLTAPLRTLAETQGFSDITFNVQTSGSARKIAGMQFWTQGAGQPQVLPDPARPGNVYVVSADSTSPSNDQMYVRIARSTNNGATWTSAAIVTPGGNSYAMFPQAAIDPFGDIVVTWYDNRRGLTNSAGRFKLDVFAKYSTDGGVTFSPEFMVNQAGNPFDPDIGAINRFAGPPPTTRIGEYFGLVLYGGTAYVAWNGDQGTTTEQVYFKSFAIRGSLTVTGTSGNDTVTVANTSGNAAAVDVTVNGQRQYAGLWSALSGITVAVTAGNDTANVENVAAGTPVTVNLSTGTATANISPTAHNLNNIQAAVTVVGDAGTDTLNVNDQGNAANQTYTLTATSVGRTGTATITFGTLMNFLVLNGGGGSNTYNVATTGANNLTTLNTGNGNDVVTVEATAATRPLTVNDGTGTDVVNVSPTARNLGNVQGGLTAVGNAGSDTLVVNDQNNTADQTYTLGATTLTRTGAAAVNFGTLTNLITLNGGGGSNTYNVVTTEAYDLTTLNTGNGNDIVNVEATAVHRPLRVNEGTNGAIVNISPTAQRLANLQSAVTIAGAAGGAGVLVLNDQNDAANVTYAVGNGAITGVGAGVSFGPVVGSVSLNGGSGADTYRVANTAAAVGITLNDGPANNTVNVLGTSDGTLTVNTGTNDVVNLGSAAGTLDPIGAVGVNDATGTATVNLDDSGFAGSEDYVIVSYAVGIGRSSGFGLSYAGIAALNLGAGNGGDVFDIDSTSAGTTVNAGAGGNVFHVSPYTQWLAGTIGGALTLNGGGGDILEFFDANDPNSETFSFDSIPATLTLGSTGGTIAAFAGMGGGVYVVTNGFSTPDDQSGTVIFDPSGGPPSPVGGGAGGRRGTAHDGAAVMDAALRALAGAEVGGTEDLSWVLIRRGTGGPGDLAEPMDQLLRWCEGVARAVRFWGRAKLGVAERPQRDALWGAGQSPADHRTALETAPGLFPFLGNRDPAGDG